MSKMFYGQLNMTELIEAMKTQHTAFKRVHSKKQNKDLILVNVTMWENDQADQFGNTISLQLNSREDAKALEGKVYIGNLKLSVPKEAPITKNDINALNDLENAMNGIPSGAPKPFRPAEGPSNFPDDDLPF